MNVHLYVREPAPMRQEERQALDRALQQRFGGEINSHHEWIGPRITGENVIIFNVKGHTKTTINKIADAIQIYHQAFIFAYPMQDRLLGKNTLVDVQSDIFTAPEWYLQRENERINTP